MFLFTNAIHLLPYTGAGSGMLRALSENMNVSFTNNDRTNEFVITINRPVGNQVNEKSNQVNGNLDTKLRHLDTNPDTGLGHSDTDLDTNSDTLNAYLDTKHPKITNIMSLVEVGYLEMTNPEHPNASNQKYRRSKK